MSQLREFEVELFNKTFGHPAHEEPVKVIDIDYINKRISFIEEELRELKEAAEKNDMVGCLDALLDIDYFNLGTVNGLGLTKKFQEGFEIVQESNMNKSCVYKEDAYATIAESEEILYIEESNTGRWILKRESDNKIMKPLGWKPPNLKQLFSIVIIIFSIFISSCSIKIATLTTVSTRNIDNKIEHVQNKKEASARGKNIDKCIDRCLNKNDGEYIMNARIYHKPFAIFRRYKVAGDVWGYKE